MNRRTFLSSTILATSGALLHAEKPAHRPLRIGFLGAAHSHGPAKVKITRDSPDWDLIGVAEPDDKVRARLGEIPFLSREEVLERAEVIAVESAVADHVQDALAALQAGKHLHLEKPPATNMADLRTILRLAAEKQRVVQMGYMWRYNPGVNRILEAAREGWLGKVHAVRGVINTKVGDAERKQNAQFAGGTLFELGCHLIDPITRMLGTPKRVMTTLQHIGPPMDGLADNCMALMEYDGALATVASSALQPGAGAYRSLEVVGTNGIAVLRPIERPTLMLDLAKAAGPYAAGKQNVPLPDYQRYAPELADLASAIRENRPLSVTHEQELQVQETLLLCCGMGEPRSV